MLLNFAIEGVSYYWHIASAWVLPYPDQIAAIAIWSQAEDFRRVPPVTPDPEESKRFATVMNDVKTYVDEMVVKFIMGQEPLSG